MTPNKTRDDFLKALEIELRREEYDYKDLLNDFDFVKDLNTQIARRYQDLMSSFPTVKELNLLIKVMDDNNFDYDTLTKEKRLMQLRRFKSALVRLEEQDLSTLPPKYDDIEKNSDELKESE